MPSLSNFENLGFGFRTINNYANCKKGLARTAGAPDKCFPSQTYTNPTHSNFIHLKKENLRGEGCYHLELQFKHSGAKRMMFLIILASTLNPSLEQPRHVFRSVTQIFELAACLSDPWAGFSIEGLWCGLGGKMTCKAGFRVADAGWIDDCGASSLGK